MSITKVTRNFQVTIPADVREKIHLKVGTVVDFVVRKGKIFLMPKKLVNEDEAYFWAKEWQEGEKEADEDIKTGRISGPYATAKDLQKALDKLKK